MMTPPTGDASDRLVPDSQMDLHNGSLYFWSYVLIFAAGPIMYLGVLQAALCDKLGAGPMLANLPSSTFAAGMIAPLLASWLVPYRFERDAIVGAFALLAGSFAAVAAILILPVSPSWKIAVVVGQGLLQGVAISVSDVFSMQCLGRGATTRGRSEILKKTFTVTPAVAVAGSLGVQSILDPGFSLIGFPYNFVLIFALGAACSAGVAALSSHYQLIPLPAQQRQPLGAFLMQAGRRFTTSKSLALLWLVYFCWTCSRLVVSNLSLYSKQVVGRPPSELSGWMMAIQFAGKAGGGYILGRLAIRFGQRSAVLALLASLIIGVLWAWIMPGYVYLFAFAWIGGTILGGAYLPNYVLTLSPAVAGAANLSLLALAGPAAGFAPALHGWLAERFGFSASFTLALGMGVLGACLVAKIRENPK